MKSQNFYPTFNIDSDTQQANELEIFLKGGSNPRFRRSFKRLYE